MDYIYLGEEDEGSRLRLLNEFYFNIYRYAFTDPDTSEDPMIWTKLFDEDSIEIILAHDGEKVVGGIVFEWFLEAQVVLVTYLAVHPDHLRQGIGRLLTEEMKAAIITDGWLVLAEAEDPVCAKDVDAAQLRLKTIDSYGWRKIPMEYVQPPLRKNGEPGKGLMLVAHGETTVSSTQIASFLNEFYESLNQMDRSELVEMRLQLATKVVLQTHGFTEDSM